MSDKEVFEEITSKSKWYIGFCSQPHSVYLAKNFKNDGLKDDTLRKMFNHFGYQVKTNRNWKKK